MYEPKIGVVKQMYEPKIAHTKFNVTKKVQLFCFIFWTMKKVALKLSYKYTLWWTLTYTFNCFEI